MKQKPRSRVNRKKAKTVLRLPDLEHAKAAVLNSLTSADAQRGYRHAIDEFVDWYCSEPRLAFNRIVVLRYRSYLESRQLAPGTINLRLGAVRRLAYEAADCGLLSSDLAAGIRRVKGVKKLGVRLGNWLTVEQAHSLWQAPDSQGLKGKRDRALLALLLTCGLRRHEAVSLRIDDLQQREDCRFGGQGRTRPNGSDPRLGERAVGRVDEGSRNRRGQDLPQGHQDGADMGRLHDGKVDLAHCEGLRERDRYA
jgi:integrase